MSDDDLVASVKFRCQMTRVTQVELARRLHLTQGHVSKIMSRKVSLSDKARVRLEQFVQDCEPPTLPSQTPSTEIERLRTEARLIMQNMQFWLTACERLCDSLRQEKGADS